MAWHFSAGKASASLIAAGSLVLGVAGATHAAHVDQFGVGNDEGPLVLLPGDADGQESGSVTDSSTIPLGGNTRVSTIAYGPDDPEGIVVSSQVDITTGGADSNGVLEFSNSANTQGELTLDYGTEGDLGDLTANSDGATYDFLRTTIQSVDGGNGNAANFTITATDSDGDSGSADFSAGTAGDYFTPYAAFGSSVDFDSLDTLSYEVVGDGNGLDVAVDEIFRSAAPEPTSMALFGLGLGLVAVGRRNRKA